MLADIHGIDPTKFRANLGEQPPRDGSRKKRGKQSAELEEAGSKERVIGDDALELHQDALVEHLDIQA
jgi:hypothetical protein